MLCSSVCIREKIADYLSNTTLEDREKTILRRLVTAGTSRVSVSVFGWTKQKFPFTVKSVHLTIAEHVVTVTGKALYDIAHAPADHSNRRHSPKDYAVWEIHPVMKLEVVQ